MTLTRQEIMQIAHDLDVRLRVAEERRELRLPFNGELSPDERRMLEQGTFEVAS